MNTPTPRTDKAIANYGDYWTQKNAVSPDFARQLETELAAATKERDEARAERDGLHALHNKNAAYSQELLDLCNALRADNAKLRAALENAANESQILVNIIKQDTEASGICVLRFDTTRGTRIAINKARAALAHGSHEA